MSGRIGSSFFFWALFAVGCSDSNSESPSDDTSSTVADEVALRIDDAVSEGFSGAILITLDGEPIVTKGYGLADRENEVPNTEETAFDVGSILKTFTAAAIFKLQEDGLLALSDTLGSIFPDAPQDKADITLLEVLQHTAGFDEFHDTMGDFEEMTRTEARQRIFGQELLFEPGSDEAYSNSGYTLLADVVETVSGEAFTHYVHQNLFAPAGMDASGFYSEDVWQTVDTAIGYDASTFGDNDPATWPYTWSLMGNGGLVSTVVDLERFVVALWSGDVLGSDAVEAMRTDYLSSGAVEIAGKAVYGQAGAGDYGLGGVVIDVPETESRILIATNTFEVFDIESFAADLAVFLVEGE